MTFFSNFILHLLNSKRGMLSQVLNPCKQVFIFPEIIQISLINKVIQVN
jgi:hypothetical protein